MSVPSSLMVKVDIGRPPILCRSAAFHAQKMIVNLTIAIITGFVDPHGVAALAGYGAGSRLEFILVSLSYGGHRLEADERAVP
jgi:hypothetical protein